jgi:hypothetical protein
MIGGGRIYVKLQPGQQAIAWVYFDPLPTETVVGVEVPQMFPFDDVTVTEGAGTLTSASTARSTPHGAVATLVAAKRGDEALRARLELAAEPGAKVHLRDPYFEYRQATSSIPSANASIRS